jgi:peptidoglycan hydrolase CwlO-like protein
MIETLAKYFTEMFTLHPYLSILLLSIVLISKYSWPYLFKKEQNEFEINKIKIEQDNRLDNISQRVSDLENKVESLEDEIDKYSIELESNKNLNEQLALRVAKQDIMIDQVLKNKKLYNSSVQKNPGIKIQIKKKPQSN